MSYLGLPFQHDVFVSYAHGRGERLRQWSLCLANELKGDILDLMVEFDDLDIFFDEQLDPARPLTDQLRGIVKATGLLLIVMSNRYLDSAWCKDELDWFEEELRQCQSEGGSVLVVRAQATGHDDWPQCLKDERGHPLTGFRFYSRENDTRPYGWPEPQAGDRAYFEALGTLSTAVTRKLQELKERIALEIKARQPRVHIAIEGEPQIYLQAPASARQAWTTTKRALQQAGCRVLPEEMQQVDSDLMSMQSARKQRLQLLYEQANALCLLRPPRANGIQREIESIVSDRSALQAFDKDIPCAVIDQGSGNLPLVHDLGIDAIDATGDNWMLHFQDWLHGALQPGNQP